MIQPLRALTPQIALRALTIALCWAASVRAPRAIAAEPITFAAYNVENYLVMERRELGNKPGPKPEAAKQAIARIIAEINPNILGVVEMGDREQFDDFRRLLAGVGQEFKDSEWIEGEDTSRHVALLSKFPIVERNSVTDASYQLAGRKRLVQRGFLDVTIQVNETYRLRSVGVHLKSRRPVPEGEAIMRRNEAALLRKHLTAILENDPAVNLIAWGDFNDTKDQPPIQEIRGPARSPIEMRDVWLKDAVGDRWTYFGRFKDGYDRIDYFFANRGIWKELDLQASKIVRTPDWNEASDHRPITLVIRPSDVR